MMGFVSNFDEEQSNARSKKTWISCLKDNLGRLKLNETEVMDREKRKDLIKTPTANPERPGYMAFKRILLL